MTSLLVRLRQRRPPARRVAVAFLAFAAGLAVVVVSAERGGSLGPWSGFLGMIGLIVLVVGLLQGDVRVLGAAAAVLGTSAVIGGNGKGHGLAGAAVTAALGAGLLLMVELGQWSNELGVREGPRGKDPRRVGMVVAATVGGGAVGATAVATATTATPGGIVLVVAGAVACCLLALLFLLLVTEGRA